MSIQYVNKNCPVCGGHIYVTDIGTEVCQHCGYVIPQSTFATTSTSETNKYCQMCNTKLEHNGNWWECPNCHYGHMDYIGDPPGDLYIKSDGVGTAWGRFDPELIPLTLQIDTELIKLKQKEMELEFELEPDKLENIDTIIINGYKYVKEK